MAGWLASLLRPERLFDPWAVRYLEKGCRAGALEAPADAPEYAMELLMERIRELMPEIRRLGWKETGFTPRTMADGFPELAVYLLRIRRGLKRSYLSLPENRGLERAFADDAFVAELKTRARDLGISALGFCRVNPRYVLRGRYVLYPNAIVCLQEMKRCEMETAPGHPAALETMRVYANLGRAMNELVDWMRSRGVAAQAGHPFGGLALYPALAADAGLGYRCRTGLLVTPQFGQLQRIGAIYTPDENLPFAGANEHEWVLEYCDSCDACIRACPGDAILERAVPNVEGIVTSIDNDRCFPWFALKGGCSVCIKVCPFSRGQYESLRQTSQDGV